VSKPLVNRRIGERYKVDVRDVAWVPLGRRRLVRRRPQTARLVDLSVTGGSVLAAPGVGVGDLVHVKVGGGGGVVEVRRAVECADPELCCYGVRFVALDEVFVGVVADTLAAHRPGREWRWEFAS
jgi:hypothetical protein